MWGFGSVYDRHSWRSQSGIKRVLQNPVATDKMKREVKYLLSKPKFTVNELKAVVETIHDLSAEMQENVHTDYVASGDNEAAAMEQ